jgi:hypothetical protein
LTGAGSALGDAELDRGDAVIDGASFGRLERGAEVEDGRTVEVWPVGPGSAASGRNLSPTNSSVNNTALSKTNPPMAIFGQWPFRVRGMRRSLTGQVVDGGHGQPAGTGYRGLSSAA